MRIAFDAKRAFCNASGLGTYSRNLIDALLRYFPQDEYHLFTPYAKLDYQNQFHVHLPASTNKIMQDKWRIYDCHSDINGLQPNVYHGLSNELPFSAQKIKAKKVVTIHDVIFRKYTDQYAFLDRVMYDRKTAFACKHADVVIACSEETKHDLMRFYSVSEGKIKVVYQSCHPVFFEKSDKPQVTEMLQKYGINQPYILHVGSLNERKNQLNLIRAYAQLHHRIEEMLVLIANEGSGIKKIQQEIESHKLQNKVKLIHGVQNQYLPAFYRGASLFVFPSFYEGFGIPLLEAMCSGTPVACSEIACFKEVCGEAAGYFDPHSASDIADKISQILYNKALKDKLVTDGNQRASELTPQKFAAAVHRIYES